MLHKFVNYTDTTLSEFINKGELSRTNIFRSLYDYHTDVNQSYTYTQSDTAVSITSTTSVFTPLSNAFLKTYCGVHCTQQDQTRSQAVAGIADRTASQQTR